MKAGGWTPAPQKHLEKEDQMHSHGGGGLQMNEAGKEGELWGNFSFLEYELFDHSDQRSAA